MIKNDQSCAEIKSARRVLAWWDVDLRIGAFHKRKVTARPLKELEHVLGHRLHVESWMRYDVMAKGEWKIEAYHYLDTADCALAAYMMLKQLGPIAEWFGMSWQGFNTAVTTASGDPDDATICAFYWNPPDQRGMPRYVSTGVMLQLVTVGDEASIHYTRRDRLCRHARPVVQLPSAPERRDDYLVEFTVHIVCRIKQDVMSFHWPRFQAARWPKGVDDFDVDARTHEGKPNIIRVRQTLRQFQEHEAVVHCLAFAQSFQVRLNVSGDFRG